jgi:hypothetical protein
MKLPTILFLILFFSKAYTQSDLIPRTLEPTFIFAQDNVLRQISKHRFLYNGHIGKLHTFQDVMLLDSDFKNFNSNRKFQIGANVVSGLLGIPCTYIGTYFLIKGYEDSPGYGIQFLGIGLGITGLGLIFSNIAFGSSKGYYKTELLKKVIKRDSETGYLRIEATQSGLGLVYRF